MNKLLPLVFLLFIFYSLDAQEGGLLLTNFKESRDIENQNWAICQDINHVMLFANRKGILSFDGQDWLSVRMPVIPFSMKANSTKSRIFIGGENNFGFLEKNQSGLYNYVSLSGDTSDLGIITKIVLTDSIAWFYGDKSISRYNLAENRLDLRLKSVDENPFTGIIVTPGNTFINVLNKGLYRLESDTLFPIVTGYLTADLDILFSLPYNRNSVLVGLSDGRLSLFDGLKYSDYQIKDDNYIRDNTLSDGIAIGDSLYAFSTLDGGAMVIDKKSGKIQFAINNQNALPDDEIFAIGLDESGGLWLSHQYGLTRADLNLPVRNFSIYPGLKGNLTSSMWHNNELYVGTSEGVFYLTEVKNYSDVQVLIKGAPENTVTADMAPQKAVRKNIFTRIFGKKTSSDQSSAPVTSTKSPVEQYSRATVSKLKSINYIFKKAEGLNEKCRQLVSTGNGILAATNRGLYIINNHSAVVVADNRYINFIKWQPVNESYYIGADDGYFTVKFQNGKWITDAPASKYSNPVYSIVVTGDNKLWLGVDNTALMTEPGKSSEALSFTQIGIKNDYPQRYMLDLVNDSVFLYSETGIYFYDETTKGFIKTRLDKSSSGMRTKYLYPLTNEPWINHGNEWIYLSSAAGIINKEMSLFKIFDEVISINADKSNLWVVDGANQLYRFDLNLPTRIKPESDVFIKSIYNENGTTFNLSNIVFNRGDNIVNFDIVAPGYLKQKTTQYQYIINRLMPEWSPWSLRTTYNLMIPVPGDYTVQVRAKDLWGNIGAPELIKFTIKAPFTQTTLFFIIVILFILTLLFFIVRFREGQLQKENRILEEKVQERTAEIEAQKEEITSSIEYASRIQMAMLPEKEHFKNFFSDHFIIFKPRDIVSGDFYWIGEDEKHIYFSVADCTGHGVPGAFMSALGISTLNEIITNNDNLHANTVLSLLRDKIKTSLHQTGKEGEAADGMDVAFCLLHKNMKMLEFAGAYNPLFIYQGDELKEYKADRMPIGIYYGEKDNFTNYEINIKKGDTIYIFSDGLADQFGGPDGVKYKIAKLKKLLTTIHSKPMNEQRQIIEHEFENWRGSVDQIDDITIIGVRI